MKPFPPPRAWVDWKVPLRADGTPMESTQSQGDYEVYIQWLADYLFEKDIPVPECQKELDGFPYFVPDGFSPCEFEFLELMIGDGVDYPTYLMRKTEEWNEYYKELQEQFPDSEESDEASNREYFFETCVATEEQFNWIARELAEKKETGVPESIDHFDIPYRAVYARTLKKMKNREERVVALERFFDWYSRQLDEVFRT